MKNAYYSYNITKVINVVLFIIHSFGNRVNLSLLCKILYDADVLHLRRYGFLITRDRYMLMKNGVAPVNTYVLYTQLLENDGFKFQYDIREFFFAEGSFIYCLQQYDGNVLSASEVNCLFETIRHYKGSDNAPSNSQGINRLSRRMILLNEISIFDIARIENMPDSLHRYILDCTKAGTKRFDNKFSSTPGSRKITTLATTMPGAVLIDSFSGFAYIIVAVSPNEYMMVKTLNDNSISLSDLHTDLQHSLITFDSAYDFLPGNTIVNCSQLYPINHNDLFQLITVDGITLTGYIQAADLERIIAVLQVTTTIPDNFKSEFWVHE